MPTASKFIEKPETIWSARSVTANTAWMSASSIAGDHADDQAEQPRAGDVGAADAEEGAHQHHALEADVDDAAALGHDAAERGEQQRRRVAQHRGEQRRPGDDVARGCSTPDFVAPMPTRDAGDRGERPRPSRACAPHRGSRPHRRPAARTPRTIVGTGERIAQRGTATNTARKPSATPAQPTRAGVSQPPSRSSDGGGGTLGDAACSCRHRHRRVLRCCRLAVGSCGAAATGRSRGCRRSRTARRGPG